MFLTGDVSVSLFRRLVGAFSFGAPVIRLASKQITLQTLTDTAVRLILF